MTKETGYPHIDKPWMKQYEKKYYDIPFSKETVYDFFMKNNKDHEDNVATEFYGREIKYGQMMENIDNLSKGLVALGVDKKDRILSILPTLSTTADLFYATSKVGAVSDFYDPRPDSFSAETNGKKILEIIKREKIKHIFVLDLCYEPFFSKIEQDLLELGINNIVVMSVNDCLNIKGKVGYLLDELDKEGYSLQGLKKLKNKLINMKKSEEHINSIINNSKLNIIRYPDLIRNSMYSSVEKHIYTPDELALIVHTSGTSGAMPKPIPLTNENLNIHVQQIFATGEKYLPSDSVFHLLPYFASFGIGDVAHYGFSCGSKMIQIPEFTPDDLPRMIYKNKPNMIIAAPTMLNSLMDNNYLSGKDLSFLKRVTVGGGEFSRKKEMAEFLKKHNAENCRLEYGYGMSECTGSTSISYKKDDLFNGIGRPLPYMNYALIDTKTGKPIKFSDDKDYITGEAYVSSPTVTPGCLDGEIIVPHVEIDGIDFIKTGDLISMYKDGSMVFETRIDRTFTRFDGFKYKPYVIEEIIKDSPDIRECIINEYYDEKYKGFMPVANIVIGDRNTESKRQIVENVINNLINNTTISTRQIPTKIRFLNEIPLTKNSKYNIKELINMGLTGEEYSINIEETNLSVGKIEIINPELNNKLELIKK